MKKTITNRDRATMYGHEQGNRLDRLRLRCALNEPFTLAEAEEVLSSYQFPDGSWDYHSAEERSDRIGSLGGTIHCLRWLREFGLGGRKQMNRTLEFLLSIQSSDGSFYETEDKLTHSSQAWLQEETLIDRFFFTAAVPMRLFSLDCQEHAIIGRAIDWLAQYWTDWELITGTWYNLWVLLCLYPEGIGLRSELYQRCYATALEWLPSLEAQPLTWLLDALRGAGFSADDPLVAKGMDRLLALQSEDGTCRSASDSAIETTVTALRLLHDYGFMHVSGSTEAWEEEFLMALEQSDLSRVIEVLEQRNKSSGTLSGNDKIKALRLIRQRFSSPDEALQWAINMLRTESAATRSLGAMLASTCIEPFYAQYPRQAQELIIRIADDAHWEVREDANAVLLPLLQMRFDEIIALLRQWTKHPSENVRRAVVLIVKKAGKERRPGWGEPLLELLEPLLSDRSEYVRKSLGPFAVGDGLLRYYPDLTLERLSRWIEVLDPQVRWNVAMAFSAAEGAKHLDAALPILERLAEDNRRFVWRAVASAMRNLGRQVPERVVPVLKEWLEDERFSRPAEVALKYLMR